MKRNLGALIFFISLSGLYAQSISPTVMSSAGAVMKTANASIEWTLGELATSTVKNNNNNITQGFHQTNLTIVSTNNPLISGLDIYPNPVEHDLIISNQSGKTITFHVFTLLGQCISEHVQGPGIQTMTMNALPAGTYILEAVTNDQKQNFTIEKIK
jgi:hypothetical protein